MEKAIVFMMLLGACIACNASKHSRSGDGKIDIDSLPPTIINPPATPKPSISADTATYQSVESESYDELCLLEVLETASY